MEILYTQALTRILVFTKVKDYDRAYVIKEKYKKRVGKRFLIFPIYETERAVVGRWRGDYVCSVSDFKHDKLFIEDGEFFRKLHCRIIMNDKSHRNVYFETVEKLNKYIQDFKDSAAHFIIE